MFPTDARLLNRAREILVRLAKKHGVTPEQVMPKAQASSESTQAEGPGTIGELDQFVADFEMNSRSRRERPLNGELASPSNLTT